MINRDLKLATFSLCELHGKSYNNLKFLCRIWELEEMFVKFYVPYVDSKGCYRRGYKEEIVIRLRSEMRKVERGRKLYQRRFKIVTPESIRPIKAKSS